MRRWTDDGRFGAVGRRSSASGLAEWPMFWPGIVLVLLGTLVLIEPRVFVALVAAVMIVLGASMLVTGWRARRAWRCLDASFWRSFTRYP